MKPRPSWPHFKSTIPLKAFLKHLRYVSDKTIIRPPIITVLGHVDHGKTTLLDCLRNTSTAALEPGHITQRLAAFHLKLYKDKDSDKDKTPEGEKDDKLVSVNPKIGNNNGLIGSMTLLDTPGHAAFKTIRMRGANCTDIAVLVVACDAGIQMQTRECLELIGEDLPLIVVVNKIDKLLRRPRQNNEHKMPFSLMIDDLRADEDVKKAIGDIEHQLATDSKCPRIPESFGGDVQVVPVSALTGLNVREGLLPAITAQAMMLEDEVLRVDPAAALEAYILEATKRADIGITCTVLIRQGCLAVGEYCVVGGVVSKVRSMWVAGEQAHQCGPGMPAVVTGWPELPPVGARIRSAPDKTTAKLILKSRASTAILKPLTNEKDHVDETAVMPVILVADTIGSMEALEVAVKSSVPPRFVHMAPVIHRHIGFVTESVLDVAVMNRNTCILSFNQKKLSNLNSSFNGKTSKTTAFIQDDIIYRVCEAFRARLESLLPKTFERHVIGRASILTLYNTPSPDRLTLSVPDGNGHFAVRNVILGCRLTFGSAHQFTSGSKHGLVDDCFLVDTAHQQSTRYEKEDEALQMLPYASLTIKSMRQEKRQVSSVANGQDFGLMPALIKPYYADTIHSQEQIIGENIAQLVTIKLGDELVFTKMVSNATKLDDETSPKITKKPFFVIPKTEQK